MLAVLENLENLENLEILDNPENLEEINLRPSREDYSQARAEAFFSTLSRAYSAFTRRQRRNSSR